ncbi:hypothetical protein CLAFUW4_12740 [Fulvia fulva]|uniref:Uncharacterized protein n=1 Tax=Passalora fulva TaxID=5499 RepID=A0A9Q8PJV6_PASFU|nr:uncharacterized protein CLAFUR5_12606 [Fulvia fulva]KAK4611737.1 hypothetical protein CLAFUR4_12744 [Fulvia fulva]KAK4612375.1 hypothetical protein CLAFUR0_12751 [Fulvia fulva]UJO23719.1 hypothetical protein CLAFUR5_12606 [Fulvia fulva]WPV21573.1 hypothetical protein CLAFUW4_12740 [Fulvia fulva]WPV36173.1 hypothetical protein CLAFUW7_12747 [Fulvia fulva]
MADPNQPKEDYLDKGLDAVEKQFGKKSGHNIDPAKARSTNEKITDKIRETGEKLTGKKAPEKFSN